MPADEGRLYKIGEVCKLADVQPYVLRYWETEFPPLAPNKSGGGQGPSPRGENEILLRLKQPHQPEGVPLPGGEKKREKEESEAAASLPPPAYPPASPAVPDRSYEV